jgi:hypothetical protein
MFGNVVQRGGLILICMLAAIIVSPSAFGQRTSESSFPRAESNSTPETIVSAGTTGPDIVVISLINMCSFGSTMVGDERISAFSVGMTVCNAGDEPAQWISTTNEHPINVQNLYRLQDGRFEQVGMSWVWHEFFAVLGTQCGACQDPGGITGQHLGVNCSSPASCSIIGTQSNLSLRSKVDAFTGYFPFPFDRSSPASVIDRRLQIRNSDLEAALTESASYFVEGYYVSPDEAQAGNGLNNLSYRPVTFVRPSVQACSNRDPENDFCAIITSFTRTEEPAIGAWKQADPSVIESDVPVPNEGLFKLSTKVTNLENGFWRYEYALFNVNSHRSAGSFRVELPLGAVVQNLGFHAPFYHSGEPISNDAWEVTVEPDAITWTTTPYELDPNANALRWGTLYNFRFDVNAPPQSTLATIGLFRPGTPDAVQGNTVGPIGGMVDCNGNETPDSCDINCGAPGCEGVAECGLSLDCNANSIPDECEPDCIGNGIPDECDVRDCPPGALWCADCNENRIPDACEPDCTDNGLPNECDIRDCPPGAQWCQDCNDNLVPDSCDIRDCLPGELLCADCDENDILDVCEIVCIDWMCCFPAIEICIPNYPEQACLESGGVPECTQYLNDCNFNGVPDECDQDCTGSGIPDECESVFGYYGPDCKVCPGGANNPCFGNGLCDYGIDGSGLCTCFPGFTGPACAVRIRLGAHDTRAQ